MTRDWTRIRRGLTLTVGYIAVVVAAGAALTWSAFHLSDLAQLTSGDKRFTHWLLPASVDTAAVAGCVFWLSGAFDARAQAFGRMLALGAAGLSVCGNVVALLVEQGILPADSPVLVGAIGAVPALSAAAVVHQVVLATCPLPSRRRATRQGAGQPVRAGQGRHTDRPPAPTAAPAGQPAPEAGATPDTVDAGSATEETSDTRAGQGSPGGGSELDELAARATEFEQAFQREHGRKPSRTEVQKHLRVGGTTIAKVRRRQRQLEGVELRLAL